MKKVNVIIPVYNKDAYVSKSIESVICQEYKDWILILVDDGSTDSSGEICREYAKKDSRIKYIYQENRGVSAARNTGIRNACGDYIYFLDSDDIAEPELLKKAVYSMEENHMDLVAFNIASLAEVGEGYWNEHMEPEDIIISSDDERWRFILNRFLEYKIIFSVWNKLYKLSLIHKNKIFFEEGVSIGEDIGFNLKYLLYVNRIQTMEETLYQYWKREESAMSQDTTEIFRLNDFSKMLEGVKKQGKGIGIKNWNKKFYLIYIKAMDNQYKKRKKCSQLRPYVKQIENKKFYFRSTMYVILHPFGLLELYQRKEGLRKWKEHLSCMWYLLF